MSGPHDTEVTLRPGGPDDRDEIFRIHRSSILELGRQSYSREEVESWAHGLSPDRYPKAMRENGETFILAIVDERHVAGFASCRDSEVLALYVDPAWARRGIGGRLLAEAERIIAAQGFGLVRISASLNGRPFYEAKGYRLVETGTWKTRGGLEVTRLEMRKRLER